MGSRWEVGWSLRSHADIGSRLGTSGYPSDCPRCSLEFIRVSVAPYEAFGSSVFRLPWN